jgi:hypothetical protein
MSFPSMRVAGFSCRNMAHRRRSATRFALKAPNKDRRDAKIFDMWMACHTQEEIAEAVGCDQKNSVERF